MLSRTCHRTPILPCTVITGSPTPCTIPHTTPRTTPRTTPYSPSLRPRIFALPLLTSCQKYHYATKRCTVTFCNIIIILSIMYPYPSDTSPVSKECLLPSARGIGSISFAIALDTTTLVLAQEDHIRQAHRFVAMGLSL